jgi:hypothetical protein
MVTGPQSIPRQQLCPKPFVRSSLSYYNLGLDVV